MLTQPAAIDARPFNIKRAELIDICVNEYYVTSRPLLMKLVDRIRQSDEVTLAYIQACEIMNRKDLI